MAALSPLNHLEALLRKPARIAGQPSIISKLFDIAKKTIGIDESNYLPWKNEYLGNLTTYIDGIPREDLKGRQLVWGYDPFDRPFIVFEYTVVDKTGEKFEEFTTLFQRYSYSVDNVMQAGMKRYCFFRSITGDDCTEIESLFHGSAICRQVDFPIRDKISINMITT